MTNVPTSASSSLILASKIKHIRPPAIGSFVLLSNCEQTAADHFIMLIPHEEVVDASGARREGQSRGIASGGPTHK